MKSAKDREMLLQEKIQIKTRTLILFGWRTEKCVDLNLHDDLEIQSNPENSTETNEHSNDFLFLFSLVAKAHKLSTPS